MILEGIPPCGMLPDPRDLQKRLEKKKKEEEEEKKKKTVEKKEEKKEEKIEVEEKVEEKKVKTIDCGMLNIFSTPIDHRLILQRKKSTFLWHCKSVSNSWSFFVSTNDRGP